MEDQVQSTESTGVESASVAGEQTQDTFTQESSESPSYETNTGVETTEVAAQVKDEKDFSAALKAREAQLRQQMEKDYVERIKGMETQAQMMDRVAKFYGYESHDEFVQAFEQAEQQRLIQQEAQKLGVDESVIRDHLSPLKQQLSKYESELQALKHQESVRQVEAEVASLKAKYPDFGQYEQQVFDMVMKGEAGSLETAYRLASYDDKMAAIAKQKEQEVLANVTKRSSNQVLSSNDGPSNTQFSIANASLDDIRKISERVQRGERITF